MKSVKLEPIIFIIVVALLIGLLLFMFYQNNQGHVSASDLTAVAKGNPKMIHIKSELSKLHKNNQKLESSLVRITENLTRLERSIHQIQSASIDTQVRSSTGEEIEDPDYEDLQFRQEQQYQRDREMAKQKLNHYEDSLFSEERDDDWAYATESILEDFANNENLLATEFVGAECKQSFCRVQYRSNVEKDLQQLNYIIDFGGSEGYISETTLAGDSHRTLTLYLSREAHSLPRIGRHLGQN